jgi:hypothetical protein
MEEVSRRFVAAMLWTLMINRGLRIPRAFHRLARVEEENNLLARL